MRYEALTRRGYTATPAEIEELTGFGEVTGDKQAYFEQWATGKESAASSGQWGTRWVDRSERNGCILCDIKIACPCLYTYIFF